MKMTITSILVRGKIVFYKGHKALIEDDYFMGNQDMEEYEWSEYNCSLSKREL